MNYFLKVTQPLSGGDHREGRQSGYGEAGEEPSGGRRRREVKWDRAERGGGNGTQRRKYQQRLPLTDLRISIT